MVPRANPRLQLFHCRFSTLHGSILRKSHNTASSHLAVLSNRQHHLQLCGSSATCSSAHRKPNVNDTHGTALTPPTFSMTICLTASLTTDHRHCRNPYLPLLAAPYAMQYVCMHSPLDFLDFLETLGHSIGAGWCIVCVVCVAGMSWSIAISAPSAPAPTNSLTHSLTLCAVTHSSSSSNIIHKLYIKRTNLFTALKH